MRSALKRRRVNGDRGQDTSKQSTPEFQGVLLAETADNVSEKITIKAPPDVTADYSICLPAAQGNTNEILSNTDGAGTMGWVAPGAAGVGDVVGPASATDTAIPTFDGTTGKLIQDNPFATVTAAGIITSSAGFNAAGGATITASGGVIASASSIEVKDGGDFIAQDGGRLQLNRADDANYVRLQAGAATATYTVTLPSDSGAAGEALYTTDGTGTLDFAAGVTFNGGNEVRATGGLRAMGGSNVTFQDDDDTNQVIVTAPTNVTESHTIRWPASSAAGANYILENTAGNGTLNWIATPTGDVVGPVSSTDNAIARFDSTTGKLLQNSLAFVTDTGEVHLPPGSGSAPSLTFTADTTTGLCNPAAGQTCVVAAGAEAFRFKAATNQSFNPLRNIDGDATTPAYSFSNRSNSGMYLTDTANPTFAAAGLPITRMHSDGMDIYTGKLHLEATGTSSALVSISAPSSITAYTITLPGATAAVDDVLSSTDAKSTVAWVARNLLPTYTTGTLPTATAGKQIWLSDVTKPAYADGSNWYYYTDVAV